MIGRAYLSIGEVLLLLQEEFADITISKIRFLESQGLIEPERTASGYRKFYDEDVERLRFILREQKDHYLPLRVIKSRLEAGEATGPIGRPEGTLSAMVEHEHELSVDAPPTNGTEPRRPEAAPGGTDHEHEPALDAPDPDDARSWTVDELALDSGLAPAVVRDLAAFGVLTGTSEGGETVFDGEAVRIAHLAAGLVRFGLEPRHLRMYRQMADREASLYEQVVIPLVKQRNPVARSQAMSTFEEMARLAGDLRARLLERAANPFRPR